MDSTWIESYGRIGRSLGCPAVGLKAARQVIDNLKNGQLIFSYYPDRHWLENSSLLNCNRVKVVNRNTALN